MGGAIFLDKMTGPSIIPRRPIQLSVLELAPACLELAEGALQHSANPQHVWHASCHHTEYFSCVASGARITDAWFSDNTGGRDDGGGAS